MKRIILFAALFVLTLFSCQKKDSLTEFRENVAIRKTFYFEPSTLRMVNLKRNPEFDKMVKDLQEATYLMVDENMHSDSAIHLLKEKVVQEGYEEMLTIKNKNADVSIYAITQKSPVILAIAKTDTLYHIVEMRGIINLLKVPELVETFSDGDYLNVMKLAEQKKRNPHIEPDTANQRPE